MSNRLRIAPLLQLIVLLVGTTAGHSRDLSFEDRVVAQAAIERVYYQHQTGATEAFATAVPRSVLEKKVRTYLKESAALESFWNTPVTDQMLTREVERMAGGSRMPERLVELYAALGNDSFLIKECLARPVLVDRLSRNFFAFEQRVHADARNQAEEIHRRLMEGRVDPKEDHERRSVIELIARGASAGACSESSDERDPERSSRLDPEEYEKARVRWPASIGAISEVEETREAFVVRVALDESIDRFDGAVFTVPKTTWDDWWGQVQTGFDDTRIVPVAREGGAVLAPQSLGPSCGGDNTWDNGTLDDAVAGRWGHTAVWTGSLMLVWGGNEEYDPVRTGGRYDPATDTWSPTSLVNVPAAARSHTAVWTGSLMVVWGGTSKYQWPAGSGRYDPVSDTWTPMSTLNAPVIRASHTAVWTGSRMMVWGGWGGNSPGAALNTGGLYDPVSDTWMATSIVNAPLGRYSHTAVWTGSRVIIWGGAVGQGLGEIYPRDDGASYDPSLDSWSPISNVNAPSARAFHTAVWTGSMMVVWGGSIYGGYGYKNDGARYDPVANTWTPTSPLNAPVGRANHTAVWTGSLVIVWGGAGAGNTGGSYDPALDTWSATDESTAPSSRVSHTAVWTGSRMIIWGGNYSSAKGFNSGGRYDPTTNTWTPTALSDSGAPTGRRAHTAVWTGSVMVIWGGIDPGFGSPVYFATGGRYDPATDSWTPTTTTNAPGGRTFFTAVWAGSRMIVWGGTLSSGGSWINSGGRYDPIADTWLPTTTTNAPVGRRFHSVVWTGSHMIVWGGETFTAVYTATGGKYDPVADTWSPTSTLNAPTGRIDGSAIWTGSRMVIWGGASYAALFNTGGRYDPVSDVWTPTTLTNAPAARSFHTTAWTGSRMLIWGGAYLNGASYDPVSDRWTPMTTTNAPTCNTAGLWADTLLVLWCASDFDSGGRYDPVTDTWVRTITTGGPPAVSSYSHVWTGTHVVIWGGWASQTQTVSQNGGRLIVADTLDRDGDQFAACAGDCNDSRAAVYPGAPAICDGVNNDCNDPGWPGIGGTNEVDEDGDGLGECGDCDDADAAVWSIPSESAMWFGSASTLFWAPPSEPGGTSTLYDTLRSGSRSDFSQASDCVETDGVDNSTLDREIPSRGSSFYYLVRAKTSCGVGTLGRTSAGVERIGRTCP